MKCQISCSFGEIIDKITILKIKAKKIVDINSLKNVILELETLQKENPLSDVNDDLFNKLQIINEKLWMLEDNIREKSKNKVFDNTYIEIAESIHITNDERCNIKKLINIKYNSELIEEKSYYQNNILYDTEYDTIELDKCKVLYNNGKYNESYLIINKLMQKYKLYNTYDNFFVELNFTYKNLLVILNYNNEYIDNYKYIINNLDNLNILPELKVFCKKMYVLDCLHNKYYCNDYLNLINDITGPNINYSNMSFFKENDINKTLLIYDGGGIGDKFMFSRFIPILCNKFKNNKVIFFTNDNIIWIFTDIFKNIINLEIIPYSKSNMLPYYHYHCGLITLIKYLKITYENITFTPLFQNIKYKNYETIINKIKNSDKKTFIFNWKGNILNLHEKYNRRLELIHAIPLFKMANINWIVITKDITREEASILKKYNINYYGDILDNGDNCFKDSISIMKHVDGVISTDTSLVHLSANLNVKTYVMLTFACEWRWTKDKITNWYPNSILIRQNKINDWTNVINDLLFLLNK